VKLRSLIFVLLMPVTAAFAADQPAADQNLRIIQVDGHGTARSDPDQAFLSFAIDTQASNARDAGTQNAQIASKVMAALKSKVSARDKVETGGYGLTQLYGAGPSQSDSRVRYWIAYNDVVVESDPAIAGNVLDVAQAAGAVGSSQPNGESGKATMMLQVSVTGLTAAEASRLSAEKARKVAEVIEGKFAEKSTTKITPGTLQPEQEQRQNGNPNQLMIGYQASNSISVETTAIDQVGSLIDAAIGAGATRVTFVNFNLRDDSKVRSEAFTNACRDAQLKANAAAQALGLRLRRVVKITSAGDFMPQQQQLGYGDRASFSASVMSTTPIKPGEMTVQATVTVIYELE
jgi:uncharacterized protein YggE